MDRITFDKSLGIVVERVGENLKGKHSELSWKAGWKGSLYTAYEAERLHIRKQMGLDPDPNGHRIDRHKVSAALARAILLVSPLVAGGVRPSPGARLANESLTLLAGMILIIQMVEKRLKQAAPSEVDKIWHKEVKFPPANDVPYVSHYCKALYHTKSNGVDPLVLANNFFLLEAFHLLSLGVTALPVAATQEEMALSRDN